MTYHDRWLLVRLFLTSIFSIVSLMVLFLDPQADQRSFRFTKFLNDGTMPLGFLFCRKDGSLRKYTKLLFVLFFFILTVVVWAIPVHKVFHECQFAC